MERAKLVETLSAVATLLELLGENPFKIRAHQNGARIIEMFEGDLDKAIEDESIGEIKGIGPALKEKITEFYKTGKIAEHENLKLRVPQGVIDMLSLSGLGPKKVRVLFEKMGIESVSQLEMACLRNRLVELAGFGEKTQVKILAAIEFQKKFQNSFLFSDAVLEARLLAASLKSVKSAEIVEVAGSLRRKKEIVKDMDVLVATRDPQSIAEKFLKLPQIDRITANGDTKISAVLKNGMACDLRIVTPEEFPFALLYFTGSKEHNVTLRQIAKEKNLKLNEYGLFPDGSEQTIACSDETAIFKVLGLDYIVPELRENMGEIVAAQQHTLPTLIENGEIKGVFHCHTTDSDGMNTLEEMVAGAQRLGFEYIGISDHSASSEAYANGLRKDRMMEQFKKINEMQKQFKIKIFRGVESDILSDGSLDYEDEFLIKFDFIIGSLHGGLTQAEDKMTARVLKALTHPLFDFFGHPTARILMGREPAKFNVNTIIDEACKQNVIMELNANPQRLDLDWRYGKYLKEKKGRVSINPDAHSVAGLEDIEFGIGIARKAWLGSKDVVNVLPANKVLSVLKGYGARKAH